MPLNTIQSKPLFLLFYYKSHPCMVDRRLCLYWLLRPVALYGRVWGGCSDELNSDWTDYRVCPGKNTPVIPPNTESSLSAWYALRANSVCNVLLRIPWSVCVHTRTDVPWYNSNTCTQAYLRAYSTAYICDVRCEVYGGPLNEHHSGIWKMSIVSVIGGGGGKIVCPHCGESCECNG